jgi:uncharacterized membrane protein YkvA (DUF1232 family)
MQFIDFETTLRNNTENYIGDFDFIIKKSPELYALVCELLIDEDLPKEIRSKLFSVIGYFIIPKDLYSEEEHGPIGYIDDLMLVIFVLKEIQEKESLDKILFHSKIDKQDVLRILNDEYYKIISAYPELYQEVINFMGF